MSERRELRLDEVLAELDRILAPGRGRYYLLAEETPAGRLYFRVTPDGERTQIYPPPAATPRRRPREVRLPPSLRIALYLLVGFLLAEGLRGCGAISGLLGDGQLPLGLYLFVVASWPFALAIGLLGALLLALWRLLSAPV